MFLHKHQINHYYRLIKETHRKIDKDGKISQVLYGKRKVFENEVVSGIHTRQTEKGEREIEERGREEERKKEKRKIKK